ncbi:MAG: hypothetical protein M1401_10430 [Chloroflexi bacterium]|nr:hypothetical protein [Chloroflexota bacterium]
MKSKVQRAVLLLVALWLALLPSVAQANATPTQTQPGSIGLVVPVATRDVRIDRERLSFDLTQSPDSATVQATYELANGSGREVALDLVFVAPGGADVQAAFAGAPLQVKPAESVQLPKAWLAPDTGLDPRTGEEYALGSLATMARNSAWSFSIRLAPQAKAALNVRYEARLGYDRSRAEYILRHLVYVLGPAENWAGFGGLEVTATLPDRYILASSPALEKVEDGGGIARYAGRFEGLPAQIMRFTTMHVPNPWDKWLAPVQYIVPVVVGLLVAALAGALCSRLRRPWRAFFLGGGSAFLATMVVGLSADMLVTSVGPLASAGEDFTEQQGYFYILGVIFWAILVVPFISSLLAATWAALGARRHVGARRPLAQGR